MPIALTDELIAKTKKGKIASAKQVYLEGDEENLQQTGEKVKQLEKSINDIAISGGASTANAVTYDNVLSNLNAVTAQGALDELAQKNKQTTTKAETLTTELDKKLDKESIETGSTISDEADKVPSSALVKKNLDALRKEINGVDERLAIVDDYVQDLKEEFGELPKLEQMTQADYEALEEKDGNTYYMCTEG